MKQAIIEDVRQTTPLIHHLTNQVVINFSANGLLSFGGAPVMGTAEEEAADMAANADGVLLNIGTLTAKELPAMIRAGQAANDNGIPVLLDPVGVAATPFRTNAVKRILENVKPTVIKGNAGELAHIAGIPWETKGVDSIGDGDTDDIAAEIAGIYETAAVVTGQTDIINTGGSLVQNQTGHPLLGKVTGAGCLLGSVLTACLSADDTIENRIQTAVEFYGLAAEQAAKHPNVKGAGTFLPHFIDALASDPAELERM